MSTIVNATAGYKKIEPINICRCGISVTADFGEALTDRFLHSYQTLFRISNKQLMQNLDDKKLLLVGGGTSTIRKELCSRGIFTEVTNLDFFFDFHPFVSHIHIKKDFYKYDLRANYYDEVWCLFSLPLYSFSEKEVGLFFAKSSLALKPNGNLRIYPFFVYALGTRSNMAFKNNPLSYNPENIPDDAKEILRIMYKNGAHRIIDDSDDCFPEKVSDDLQIRMPKDKTKFNLAMEKYIHKK